MINSKVFDLSNPFDNTFDNMDSTQSEVNTYVKSRDEALTEIREKIHTQLSPWERIQIARHPERPYTLDYIKLIMTDFLEFHGDREFGDDKAIIGGIARIETIPIMVIGHQKGRNINENLMRNFGMPHPEGFRKALRLMQLAEKFRLPIITFIDTPGAYPGIGAEERGQGRAIAYNLYIMSQLQTPIISIVIGEGASGGALAIGVADRILMLENAYYSVISPEGCAAILWKDKAKSPDAAAALKLTAEDLFKLGIIDDIIPEPDEGAHRDHEKMADEVKKYILKNLHELCKFSINKLLQLRYDRFRHIGYFIEKK